MKLAPVDRLNWLMMATAILPGWGMAGDGSDGATLADEVAPRHPQPIAMAKN